MSIRQGSNIIAGNGADEIVAFQTPNAGNNYKWYRKYKSGWVEQGGHETMTAAQSVTTTVTFPVTMADTNYTVVSQVGNSTRTNNTGQAVYNRNGQRTTTTVLLGAYGNGSGDTTDYIDWQVSGVAA